MLDTITVKGAKEHNLKDVSLELPKNELIVFTGVSGSGKSSLAFDTIFAEGQRRYIESLSTYARQFLGQMDKPNVDYIDGLSPAISIDQKSTSNNPRSTVGTVTEIYDYLRLLYARVGTPYCPVCGEKIKPQTIDEIVSSIMKLGEGTKIQILAPIARGKKGEFSSTFEELRQEGFVRVKVDGEIFNLDEDEISLFDNELKYKAASVLYDAGFRKSALKHFEYLYSNNYNKGNSTYYMARINEAEGNRGEAAKLYDEYLSNANNKTYRKMGLYYSAGNYSKLTNNAKSMELYNTFLREYPRDDYVPRIYNNFVNTSLNKNNLVQAKVYLTNVMNKFPKSWQTELALKSYLRKAFKLKNKTETYFATSALEKRYTTFRHDFPLSWSMWSAEEFGDTEKRDEYLMKTLLTSKNHYFVKGALTLANDDMIKNVEISNTYYFDEAKKYYTDSNYTKSMEMLDKIQFLNYIATGKEDDLMKSARDMAKNILMQNDFVKELYSNKTDYTLFNELSLQTTNEVDRSILLYCYGDYDNAYTEYDKIFKKAEKVNYPLFYFAEKIFKDSGNTKRLMQISVNIGKYFDYPYTYNTDLLPDEFRKMVYPRYFDEYVLPEAKHYKIDPLFVYAIMREESTFDPKAKSWVGAMGLMQLMPATAAEQNRNPRYRYDPLDLTDPKQNINIGIGHLSWLFKNENASNYIIVAASYNAGSGRGARWKKEYGTNNMYRTGRFIDIEETEYYVEKVINSYEHYSKYYR